MARPVENINKGLTEREKIAEEKLVLTRDVVFYKQYSREWFTADTRICGYT